LHPDGAAGIGNVNRFLLHDDLLNLKEKSPPVEGI
jgi:hypothetical protein